jgi:hypothetical protein
MDAVTADLMERARPYVKLDKSKRTYRAYEEGSGKIQGYYRCPYYLNIFIPRNMIVRVSIVVSRFLTFICS